MADTIRFRRGTAAQWSAVDPVLGQGEPGHETDTGLLKLGDGTSAWSALPYFLDERNLPEPGGPGTGTTVPGQVDVRAYGATGDGSTDDTAAIQAALEATPANGTCYLPPGTYVVLAPLKPRSGTTVAGAGRRLSTLRVGPAATGTRVLDLSGLVDVVVTSLGFDGRAHETTRSGVYASGRAPRNLTVRDCRFEAFMPGQTQSTAAAVYTWPSNGVDVVDNELVGCGRAITIDQPEGPVEVRGNRISAAEGEMATGVLVRRASGVSESKVVVTANHVVCATLDPGGVGAEGHAIAVFRCRDVHVTNNHCEASGRGVLVSYQSFGALVQGNTCVGNHDAGIRVEPEITSITTTIGLGLGVPRGVSVMGNVCRDNTAVGTPSGANSGIGIAMSYAAGSIVSGNIVNDNTADGIFCDSDRVGIVGNVVYNNFRGYTSDPDTGKRAGIRITAGSGCTVVANQCYDNQVLQTQQYGLSLTGLLPTTHLVHGNQLGGNAVGEVWGAGRIREGFFGSTPVTKPGSPGTATGTDAAVINRLVASLRDLGLLG